MCKSLKGGLMGVGLSADGGPRIGCCERHRGGSGPQGGMAR